jgi:hypothetical protein
MKILPQVTLESSTRINGHSMGGAIRGAALIAVASGAVGSLAFMFHVGRQQRSMILIILFTVWVLSPFAALLWADVLSKYWSVVARATLHAAALVIALGSLAIYGVVALGPPRPQPAFWFLIVPLASWLLMAVVVLVSARISGTSARAAHRR